MKSLKSLLPYFAKYKWKTLAGVLFILLANLFKTYNPVVVRNAINELVHELGVSDGINLSVFSTVILQFVGIYFLVAIFEGLFTFFMRQTIIVVSRNIEYDLKNKLYNHYQYLDQAFFRKNNTGDLMNRITEDISRVRMFIGPSIMYSLNLFIMFVFCATNMIRVNWQLALFVLIPMPILSYTIFKLNSKINKTSEELQSKLSNLTTLTQETYSGIRVIQSYVQEKAMSLFFKKASEDYKTESLKLAKIEAFYFPFIMFLVGLCLVIIVLVGGFLNINGKISIGNIAEFMLYLNMLTFPMSALGWAVALTQQASVSMRRINEFLDLKPTVINEEGEVGKVAGKIIFDEVTFEYPDSGIVALKNISFTIQKGQQVAIIGKTGSGKTTILDLCMRMYDVSKGEIRIDDKPIKDWNTKSLRNSFGYVTQDVFLFSDSIENNIKFGEKGNSGLSLEELAAIAAVESEIEKFALKYDTIVGERGVTLSGGQKQRISIARALASIPDVLLFDDCLSAVDAQTEKKIEENLRKVAEHKTSIIVTHRIFSQFNFDLILVMDKGEIIERGTHENLMQLKGLYYTLYHQQKTEKDKVENVLS
jgi:ATP-binding cassette, subfamily B, multidrug efflux pump